MWIQPKFLLGFSTKLIGMNLMKHKFERLSFRLSSVLVVARKSLN